MPSNPCTVLVVEDEILVLSLLAETLEDEGFRVVAAENGAEALEALEHGGSRVDVLFTDINMPGIDGLELARRARALIPGLPVIYASGRVATVDSSDRVEGGRFLPKPYLPWQACEAVASALGRTRDGAVGRC
jgi:CheY-like chemotaxis protein